MKSAAAKSLELTEAHRVDQLCESFEAAWQSGPRPRIEAYLAEASGRVQPALIAELVALEAELRRAAGEAPTVHEYLARFPDHATRIEALFREWPDPHATTPGNADSSGEVAVSTLEHAMQRPNDSGDAPSRYRLVRFHAKGGLGEVHVAEDSELGRRVALKRIQPCHADHAQSRRRFLREAEITARLQHPGIVPVYGLVHDAAGQPSYAMRFIEGASLKEAIARFHRPAASSGASAPGDYQALEFRQLLGSFVTVCKTVAYAHSRGVVHRDLKPANIMVGEYGETLVVDWGLARAVQGEYVPAVEEENPDPTNRVPLSESDTLPGEPMGTPAYMSPEQAAGQWDEVGPASDIYGLGATLHELLTGRPPYHGGSAEEVLEQVKQGGAAPPRQQKKDVPRPLEAICLKAMARKPEERYATALDLAADVEHWLADEPVRAWREPWRVRAGRWVKRHRTLVTSGVAVLVAAVLLLTGATVLLNTAWDEERLARVAAETAEAQERQARRDAEKAQKKEAAMANFLVAAFRSPDARIGTRELTIEDRLDLAAERLQKEFADDPVTQARLLQVLGQTYLGIGQTQKAMRASEKAWTSQQSVLGPNHPDTLHSMNSLATAYQAAGREIEALALFEETLKLRKATLGPDHPNTVISMSNLAAAYQYAGRWAEALPLFEETLKLSKATLGPDHPNTVISMKLLGTAHQNAGRLAEALPLFEESLKVLRVTLGPDHPDTLFSMHTLARAYQAAGRLTEALPLFEETLKLSKATLGPDHHHTLTLMNTLARTYQDADRLAEALPLFEESLKVLRVALGPDHPDTLFSMNTLARAYQAAGRLTEALPLFEETLKLRRAKFGPDHPSTLISMGTLARAYKDAGRLAEALPLFEQTLKIQRATLGLDHPSTLTAMNNLALAYRDAVKFAEAEVLLREALDHGRRKLPAGSPLQLAILSNLGSCLIKQGKFAEAEPHYQEYLAVLEKKHPEHWARFRAQSLLGECLTGRKQYAEAEKLLLAGYEGLKAREQKIPASGRRNLTEAAERLVKLYEAWDKPEQAAKWRDVHIQLNKPARKPDKP